VKRDEQILLALKATPGGVSTLELATRIGCSRRTALATLGRLCRQGKARSLGVTDSRGWAVFVAVIEPQALAVVIAKHAEHPLRALVSAGVLPVKKAAAALGIERAA
jgi:hypothetical protein